MVQVVVSDVNVVDGSQLPEALGNDFILFGMFNGATARLTKDKLEEILKADGVGVSQQVIEVSDSVISIDFDDVAFGDIYVAKDKVETLTLSGLNTGRVTCLIPTDRDFQIVTNENDSTAYYDRMPVNEGFYKMEIVSSKMFDAHVYVVTISSLNEI